MSSPRRVGARTSKTRDALLDCVERLMITHGYAAVTYRAVATKAGVTAGLVQYYFPTLDDVFVAAIRRRSEQNVARLTALLGDGAEHPLRTLWNYSQDESTAALTTEFLALGNHRKSIQSEIAEVTEQVRRIQLDALTRRFGKAPIGDTGMSAETMLFLLTGIPKLIRLEQGVGVRTGHRPIVRAFEQFLDAVEPTPTRRAAKRSSAPQTTPRR
jgi:AcrR family transcriptional regulator